MRGNFSIEVLHRIQQTSLRFMFMSYRLSLSTEVEVRGMRILPVHYMEILDMHDIFLH